MRFRSSAIASAVTIVLAGFSGTAFAQFTCIDSGSTSQGATATYTGDTACGQNATASGVDTLDAVPQNGYATAIGSGASATKHWATAIGAGATANGDKGTAIGASAVANVQGAAIGFAANAATNGVAIGSFATATTGHTAVGYSASATGGDAFGFGATASGNVSAAFGAGSLASGPAAVALGWGSNASGGQSVAVGADSIASGNGSQAFGLNAHSVGANSVALGSAASANNSGDVALGSSSSTATPHTGVTAMYGGSAAGSANLGVVSVGGAPGQRQIQNVAPGVIGTSSTDAVNGSQLYSVAQGVNALGMSTASALGGGSAYNPSTGRVSAPSYSVYGNAYSNVGGAIAAMQAASPVQYTAAAGSTTPNPAGSAPTNSVTLVGAGGALANTTPVTLSNVAAGVAATDAVNVSQLNTAVASAGAHYYSVSDGGTQGANYANTGATGTNALAAGVGASAAGSSATALGANANAVNTNDVALGASSVTAAPNIGTTALYGGTAAGIATSVVSVGAAGNERQITNVAPGVISALSTDVINGSQLYSVAQGVNNLGAGTAAALGGGAAFNAATAVFAMPSYKVQGDTYSNVGAALSGLDAAVTTAQNTANKALSIASNSVQYDPSQAGTGGSTGGGASGGAGTGGGTSVTLNPSGASAGVHNVAAGALNSTSTDAVNGSQLYATNQNVAAVQSTATTALNTANAANTTVYNVVTGHSGLVQTDGQTITVGKNDAASTVNVAGAAGDRVLTGVAPGTATNDAATVGQLQANSQQTINQANAYTDQRFGVLDKRLNAVGATAMAASSLIPNARAEGRFQLSVAAGTYGGATALAMGANYWVSDRLLLNAHLSQSVGSGARMGASVGMTAGF